MRFSQDWRLAARATGTRPGPRGRGQAHAARDVAVTEVGGAQQIISGHN